MVKARIDGALDPTRRWPVDVETVRMRAAHRPGDAATPQWLRCMCGGSALATGQEYRKL